MPDPTLHNHGVIAEFHANGGKVLLRPLEVLRVIAEFRANGGKVEGRPLLVLLTTKGSKSGNPHTTPVACLEEGERHFVFASKKGAPDNPQWFTNLVADPMITVELGTETFTAKAIPLDEPERTRVFGEMAAVNPNFSDYQSLTTRVIPVVELVRA